MSGKREPGASEVALGHELIDQRIRELGDWRWPQVESSMVGWLFVGASFAPLLRNARRARVVNVTLAVALVVTTVAAVVR